MACGVRPSGLTVLLSPSLCRQLVAGPFAATLLGYFGATVVWPGQAPSRRRAHVPSPVVAPSFPPSFASSSRPHSRPHVPHRHALIPALMSPVVAPSFPRSFAPSQIKVEDPEHGDPLRTWRELDANGQSPWWSSIGRNKQCIAVDLRVDAGRKYVAPSIRMASDDVRSPHRPAIALRVATDWLRTWPTRATSWSKTSSRA